MNQVQSKARNRPAPVAFVSYARPYPSLAFISLLVRLGFTTTERPFDDQTNRIAARLKPDIIVLVVDPAARASENIVREFVHNSTALIMVLGPKRHSSGFSKLLAAGADICIREDEHPDVLAAQISAAWRRAAALPVSKTDVLQRGDLQIDVPRCEVRWKGTPVSLSPTEFRVLVCLAERAGQVVSAHDMMRNVQEYSPSEKEAKDAAKVYIRRIREKLGVDSEGERLIVNVRGFGYLLDVPDISQHAPMQTDAHRSV